jgi:hypothetical protein
MGKHSIRGVLTGEELNIVGIQRNRPGQHRISGGEYTTVQEPLVGVTHQMGDDTWDLSLQFVSVTYSIAPQGPKAGRWLDKAHPNRTLRNSALWRRPRADEMPPGWTPKLYASNVIPMVPRDPAVQEYPLQGDYPIFGERY